MWDGMSSTAVKVSSDWTVTILPCCILNSRLDTRLRNEDAILTSKLGSHDVKVITFELNDFPVGVVILNRIRQSVLTQTTKDLSNFLNVGLPFFSSIFVAFLRATSFSYLL